MRKLVFIIGGALLGFVVVNLTVGFVVMNSAVLALGTLAGVLGGGWWGYRGSKRERATAATEPH